MKRNGQSGQVLVLVLLSLSVVLTLILYILSRSTTDVAVSSRQEESVRAFSAAEAGIERSLVTGVGYGTSQPMGNASYTTTVSQIASGGYNYNFPNPISSGDTVTVWFVSHDESGNLECPCFTGGTIDVCWGNPAPLPPPATTPAIETSTYYKDSANPLMIKVGRTANDPNISRRTTENSFDPPSNGNCTVGTVTYPNHKLITFSDLGVNTSGLQFMQIKMFYNNVPQAVGVKVTGATLPSQGRQFDSSGVAGDSNRRVVVYQGWPEFPFGSNTLMSPLGITQ